MNTEQTRWWAYILPEFHASKSNQEWAELIRFSLYKLHMQR